MAECLSALESADAPETQTAAEVLPPAAIQAALAKLEAVADGWDVPLAE